MSPEHVPNLYIIAGPNGAGKSIFSRTLVTVDYDVFDGDKYVTQLKEKYPETGSDVLQDRVNEHEFKLAKEKAIKEKGSFAFETNFSSSDPTKSLREFRAAGYNVHLIFMGVNTIAERIQRVSIRVKDGGHKVLEDSIVYNFEHGYANLYKYYKEFDSVVLFDNSVPNKGNVRVPLMVLHWKNGIIEDFMDSNTPAWIKKFARLCVK